MLPRVVPLVVLLLCLACNVAASFVVRRSFRNGKRFEIITAPPRTARASSACVGGPLLRDGRHACIADGGKDLVALGSHPPMPAQSTFLLLAPRYFSRSGIFISLLGGALGSGAGFYLNCCCEWPSDPQTPRETWGVAAAPVTAERALLPTTALDAFCAVSPPMADARELSDFVDLCVDGYDYVDFEP